MLALSAFSRRYGHCDHSREDARHHVGFAARGRVERQIVDFLLVLCQKSSLILYFFGQAFDVVDVLNVGDIRVFQTHQRQHGLFVTRSEILGAIGDVDDIAGRHEHAAQQIVLSRTLLSNPHMIKHGPREELHTHHEAMLPIGTVSKPVHRQIRRYHRHYPHSLPPIPRMKSSPTKSSRH